MSLLSKCFSHCWGVQSGTVERRAGGQSKCEHFSRAFSEAQSWGSGQANQTQSSGGPVNDSPSVGAARYVERERERDCVKRERGLAGHSLIVILTNVGQECANLQRGKQADKSVWLQNATFTQMCFYLNIHAQIKNANDFFPTYSEPNIF